MPPSLRPSDLFNRDIAEPALMKRQWKAFSLDLSFFFAVDGDISSVCRTG
jgi:hypothetical protein